MSKHRKSRDQLKIEEIRERLAKLAAHQDLMFPGMHRARVEACKSELAETIKKAARRQKKVKSRLLQHLTFSKNEEFFSQRARDIGILMTWPGWNVSQARLLLKMKYDIELIHAAREREQDKSVNMRAIAREQAFNPAFIESHKINEEELLKIEAEPVRAYHPKFIRRRLMLPNDGTYYFQLISTEKAETADPYKDFLPTLRPGRASAETRTQTLMRWGGQRFECLVEKDDKRTAVREYLKGWIKDGRQESKRSIMRKFGMDPVGFYRILAEVEGVPRVWMQDRSSVKRVRYKGKRVLIPYPDYRGMYGPSSAFEREAYEFAIALDPTFSFPADTEIVPGFESGDIEYDDHDENDGGESGGDSNKCIDEYVDFC